MSGDANGSEMDQEADNDAPPITLAGDLQSAHCVVSLGCESYERPSRFEETGTRGRGWRRRSHARPARRRLGGHLTARQHCQGLVKPSGHPGWGWLVRQRTRCPFATAESKNG